MTIGGGTYIRYPDSIEGYTLGAQIGKGAFGQVYEASLKYPSFRGEGSQFAIKIIDKQLVLTSDMVQRVKNEVTIHAALEHPNILRLYHFFEDDRNVYLVMELCEKGELYKLLKKNGPFGEEQVKAFVRDIVQGLAYLHAQGIIHRDLKLSNILLSKGMQAKIADFGLAVRQSNPYMEQKTLCGTPNYLPPEILSKQPYGMTADMWSLGCIIYTLLVGRPPFESSDLKETFEKVTQSSFSIPSHLSLPARNLIQNLIVKDPKKRLSLEQIQHHPFFRKHSVTTKEESVINTNRLKPIKQRIRNGTIEIDSEGNVQFDHGEDGSRVQVKKGGITVEVFYDDVNKQQHRLQQSFQYPELPSALAKRYELMRKFVHLIQSKTPKVILYLDTLKAYLMESHDFFIYYSTNSTTNSTTSKVEYDCANQSLRIIVNGVCEKELLEPNMEQVQPEWSSTERMCLMDFCTRYHQCLQVAQGLEQQGSPPSAYPFIISETTTPNSRKPSYNTNQPVQNRISHSVKPEVERRFIYGVGWCICLGSEHYVMLFDDGSSLQVNGPQNTLLFSTRPEAPVEKYSLEHSSLPQHIRLKLIHFPRFMALWEKENQQQQNLQQQPQAQNKNKFKSTLTLGTSLMRDTN